MMIKQIYVCQCDICGAIEEAIYNLSPCNEEYYECPDSWRTGQNKDVHICPECSRRLKHE